MEVRLVGALLALVEGDGVDVDYGLVEREKRVATLQKVLFELVPAVDAATSSDAYVQNEEHQADQPNSEIGQRTRQCWAQAPSRATVGPDLRSSLVPRPTYP